MGTALHNARKDSYKKLAVSLGGHGQGKMKEELINCISILFVYYFHGDDA